jgi:segregation and condensation protein A
VAEGDLVLDLDGYEGPLDVLLVLAREQKVDLTQISILQLADQYLTFIERARRLRLEIAAEYLVMAAWLAYLKSRLLLPREEETSEEPTGPELAEALAFQLRRLEAMQEAGVRLMAQPLLGRDVFPRGAPEGIRVVHRMVYDVSLYDLLKAYSEHRRRAETSTFTIEPLDLLSMEEAAEHLISLLGGALDWQSLLSFLPPEMFDGPPLRRRSAVASTLLASLELVRAGQAEIRQNGPFEPIYLRRAARE